MWTTSSGRLSRTNSVQSTTRSVSSSRSPAIPEDNAIDRKIAMWSTSSQEPLPGNFPSRLSRTASSHSIASISTTSQASSVAGDHHEAIHGKFDWTVSPVSRISVAPKHDWTMSPVTQIDVSGLNILRRESFSSQQSKSTLAEEADHEMDLKTPTAVRKVLAPGIKAPAVHEIPAPKTASSETTLAEEPTGPLEEQLLAILSKVRLAEKSQPTVMAADYKELQDRVKALEAEKATWQKRHEALHALRDEDLANLIKVRGLLAKERREHDGLKKLRDDDLKNVLELRGKLARMTWNRTRGTSGTVDRAAMPEPPQQERTSSRGSVRSSMREGSDLWQAAKTAALEQRLLEMEHANAELKKQLDETTAQKQQQPPAPVARSVPAPVSQQSPATTHPASMGAVVAAPVVSSAGMGKVEHLLAETVRHRERASVKVHELRTENETLRKEVARLEDRASELEDTVHRLQKWA